MICATRRSCHCKGIMFVNGAQYKSHPLTANSPLRGRHTGACGAKSWRYNHWICEGGNSFMCCDCGTRRYESRKCVCVCICELRTTSWGMWGIPHILNLCTRRKWFVTFMRHPLYPVGKSSRCTSKRRLVKVRCRRKSNPDSSVIHLVVCSAVEPSSTRLLVMVCRHPLSSSSPGNM